MADIQQKRIQDAKRKLAHDDLDEVIHEAMSLKASKINNQGLTAQVNTLIQECGPEETANILEDVIREKGMAQKS